MKFLAPKPHGYIDYAAVLILFLAPTLFNFGGTPAVISYVIGAMQLIMSLLTAYPLGAARVISFPAHGGVELATAIFLVVSPWLFGFSNIESARNFFVIGGITLGAVYLVTDYKAAEVEAGVRARRRMTA